MVACSTCKRRVATRVLRGSSKARYYCDFCNPTQSHGLARLERLDAPVPCVGGAVVATMQERPAPAAAPAPDIDLIRRIEELERRATRIAPLVPDSIERGDRFPPLERRELSNLLSVLGVQTLDAARERSASLLRCEDQLIGLLRALGTESVDAAMARTATLVRRERELGAREASLSAAIRTMQSNDATIAQLRKDLESAEQVARWALDTLPATPAPAEADKALANKVAAVLTSVSIATTTAPVTTEAGRPAIEEAPAAESKPSAPVLVRSVTTLADHVARMERAPNAPVLRVSRAGEKAYGALSTRDQAKVVDAVAAWLHGTAVIEHLTAALRKSPRYAQGRDLYAARAGHLRVVAERNGPAFVIVDVARHGDL